MHATILLSMAQKFTMMLQCRKIRPVQ